MNIFFFLKLGNGCFIMLCWLLPYIKVDHYMGTYIASLLGVLPIPIAHPTHPGHRRAQSLAPCATQQLSTSLSVLHMVMYICQSQHPNSSYLPVPWPSVHTSVLCLCISIPVLQIGSSVPFFSIPHIRVNI